MPACPEMPHRQWLRMIQILPQLPDLKKTFQPSNNNCSSSKKALADKMQNLSACTGDCITSGERFAELQKMGNAIGNFVSMMRYKEYMGLAMADDKID